MVFPAETANVKEVGGALRKKTSPYKNRSFGEHHERRIPARMPGGKNKRNREGTLTGREHPCCENKKLRTLADENCVKDNENSGKREKES